MTAANEPGGDQPEQYPSYPATPMPPAGQGARPGMVTGAAVIAFVAGGLGVIGGLFALVGSSVLGGGLILVALLSFAIAGVYIWGGLQALSGVNTQILVIVAGAAGVLSLINIISGAFSAVLGLALAGTIVALLLQPVSRDWVRAKGGKTF